MAVHPSDVILPLLDERLMVEKRVTEKGHVRVSTHLEEHEALISEELARETVSIDRVPIGRQIDEMPVVRQEGDVLIYPVVEEILVVEKRLYLKEELHITKQHTVEHIEQTVTLKSMQAVVERTSTNESNPLK